MKKVWVILVLVVWAFGCSEDPRTEQCKQADSEGDSCENASDCSDAYYCVCGDEDLRAYSSCMNGRCSGAEEVCEEGFWLFSGVCESAGGWGGDCYAAED